MNSPIVSITNLSKSYKKESVLNSLNWQIKQGDIVALLGKNAAGKSTLLESIMNLREFDNGKLSLWGAEWKDLSQSYRNKIAFVAQDTVGFEWMNVKQFLSYLGGFFPTWDENYCNQLRDRWNLDPKKKVGNLSGGQTQILHIIQALSIKPELLILDEPVAHLDPSMRRQFITELIELSCETNSTVIFSSHIISDLERVANKVALLIDGKIDIFHEIETLKSSICHLKIASNSSSELLERSDYYKHTINWQPFSGGATASIIKPMDISLQEFIKQAPHTVEYTPLSLEDWYLEVNNEHL